MAGKKGTNRSKPCHKRYSYEWNKGIRQKRHLKRIEKMKRDTEKQRIRNTAIIKYIETTFSKKLPIKMIKKELANDKDNPMTLAEYYESVVSKCGK